MAKYRQIHTSFWQDGFVLDLTPEGKYFYLYLMTNSKTTQCGIYELPKKIIAIETGYNDETVTKLLQRFVDYKKIDYFEGSSEIMLTNWIKYNPPDNTNVVKCINKELREVKYKEFANRYISTAQSIGEYDMEGLARGLQGVREGYVNNKIINNKQEIIISSPSIVLTSDESEFIKVLESIPSYPLDREKDKDYYHVLEKRYPELDLLQAINDWAIYKKDKPLKTKDTPRSQINNAFKKYVEWKKNLKSQNIGKEKQKDDGFIYGDSELKF